MVQAASVVEDLAYAADNMVDGAVAVTTGRLHLDSPEDAFNLIWSDDATALEYFRHELAHQIAMILTRMDPSALAVYKEHELPEAEEFGTPHLRVSDPVYLVVYSERETAALRSLIEAIDRSLVEVLRARDLKVVSGLIRADIISHVEARRVHASAGGFRPPPVMLVKRGN